MILITGIEQEKVLSTLETYRHVTQQSGMYMVNIQLSVLPPSGCTLTIQQNGSTKASASAPVPLQSNMTLQIVLNCASSDNIDVIIASSTASDTGKNCIKGILNIHPGSF